MTNNGMDKTQSITGFGLVGLMMVLDSLFFIFAKLLQPYMPARLATLYVMALSAIIVAAFALFKKRLRLRVFIENIRFFLVIGVLLATSTNLNYEAVAYIDPGTASMLNQFAIVFGMFWGMVWLHEKLSVRQMAGGLVAIVGVVSITFQKGDYFQLGSLLVLGSALSYSFHSAFVKKYGGKIDLIEFFAFRLIITAVFILILNLFTVKFIWPAAQAWPIIFLVAVGNIAISRALYYMLLRRFKVSVLSIMLTLSPFLTVLWSWIVFKTIPTWLQIGGGLCVIVGVLIMASSMPRRTRAAVLGKEEPGSEELIRVS